MLIQIHKFNGFCDETYYANVFLKIELSIGKLIPRSFNSYYLYFPVKQDKSTSCRNNKKF